MVAHGTLVLEELSVPVPSSISSDLLDALPPEIQAEVIRSEVAAEERRRREEDLERCNTTSDLDPATFLASLDPTLREAQDPLGGLATTSSSTNNQTTLAVNSNLSKTLQMMLQLLPQVQKVTIMISGPEVDITNTGIDPTLLEALPEDMREEVLNQHFWEQQPVREELSVPVPSSISTDFLDAMPPEI
ncbi:hypothetical protein PPACK8108_LOCUS22497 [Phakopsora pachyrhizi]|uniref:Uncharacterized protein n=1 Tax=Phakopsora pachyrhizi TaxID=170000 RepID=A0AAV0BM28_PHAPC|nr:hypothetical protein PPACK8108_LOCUS22497 [Phakopsora pachyrhizi]